MNLNSKSTLKELIQKGLYVVVSSRVLCTHVVLNQTDSQSGFISAKDLSPQKARVLLMLALTKTNDAKIIQEYFLKY